MLTRSVRSTLADDAGDYGGEDDARGGDGGDEDCELPLDDGVEDVRCDERDGDAAQRAAGGHHQVVGREIAGVRFEAGELAVAEEADAEHRGEVYEQGGAEADFDFRAFARAIRRRLGIGVFWKNSTTDLIVRPVMPHL